MWSLRQHVALRSLLMRAAVIYIPLRVVVTAIGLASKGHGPFAPSADTSPGIVLLLSLLGFLETRARREQLWWANLGYSMWHICAVFGSVAVVGEALVAIVRSVN